MRHMMIDIETLGRRPDAIITQIGAVFFDPTEQVGRWGTGFIQSVDLGSQKGRTVNTETIEFWLDQPKEASHHMIEISPPLKKVIKDFNTFILLNMDGKDEKLFVWANGACFDFPILENAFEWAGIDVPWAYHQVNDLRTIRNLVHPKRCQETYISDQAKGKRGIAHNAMDDCITQIGMLQELLTELRGD